MLLADIGSSQIYHISMYVGRYAKRQHAAQWKAVDMFENSVIVKQFVQRTPTKQTVVWNCVNNCSTVKSHTEMHYIYIMAVSIKGIHGINTHTWNIFDFGTMSLTICCKYMDNQRPVSYMFRYAHIQVVLHMFHIEGIHIHHIHRGMARSKENG